MNDPDEHNLRELLRTELRADEDRAPDFDSFWSGASARHRRRLARSVAFKISALAALIAISCFVPRVFRPAEVKPRETVATDLPWRTAVLITDWQTPTDSLLPDTRLLLPQH